MKRKVMKTRGFLLALLFSVVAQASFAQERGTLSPEPLPPLAHPEAPSTPAKELFARKTRPSAMPPRTIGFYSRGCIAGAEPLPVTGPYWQVMRLSRNRYWGHPDLIAFIERLGQRVAATTRWPGILVGDMSQPRGGPMLNGHASHQIGLDADIWLTPMPDHVISNAGREDMMAINLVRPDRLDVREEVFTQDHVSVIKAAAQDPDVQRIFVNAAIKKTLCRDAGGDRSWLTKVRPYYNHDYHMHVRLFCPRGEEACAEQDSVPPGDGCDGSLAFWFKDSVLHPRPSKARPNPPLTLAQLPSACRQILLAP